MQKLVTNIIRYFKLSIHSLAATIFLPCLHILKEYINEIKGYWDIYETIIVAILILIPIILSGISLALMYTQGKDSINYPILSIENINNEYLPVYLGYFFVAISISLCGINGLIFMGIVYLFVFLFVLLSSVLSFNPFFIFFGFSFYKVQTDKTIIYLISKRRFLKGENNITFPHLRKVTEYLFLETT